LFERVVRRNTSAAFNTTQVLYRKATCSELKRWLENRDAPSPLVKATICMVQLGSKFTVPPMHEGKREMKNGTVDAIKKDLGLKQEWSKLPWFNTQSY
jgi:hypothetical protein